jgi:hypothetical protein
MGMDMCLLPWPLITTMETWKTSARLLKTHYTSTIDRCEWNNVQDKVESGSTTGSTFTSDSVPSQPVQSHPARSESQLRRLQTTINHSFEPPPPPHPSAKVATRNCAAPASMAMATSTSTSEPPLPKLPSNPTPLSAPQEQQVRDLYYKNVRAKCAEEIGGTQYSLFVIFALLD